MKIMDILVFLFLFLMAKIDGGVQIESNWKFRGLNWEFLKFMGGISKQVKVWGSSMKFSLFNYMIILYAQCENFLTLYMYISFNKFHWNTWAWA